MKIWGLRGDADNVLLASDEKSHRIIRRLEPGELVQLDVVRCRSPKWNKLYWALCDEIGQNQDPPVDEHVIDPKVRVWAGHYEVMGIGEVEVGGEKVQYEIRSPKSIAFKNLSHDQWVELWPSIELAMHEHYGIEPQITPIL